MWVHRTLEDDVLLWLSSVRTFLSRIRKDTALSATDCREIIAHISTVMATLHSVADGKVIFKGVPDTEY